MLPRLFLTSLIKVNHPSGRGTVRTRVEILSVEIGEEDLGIARVLCNPSLRLLRLQDEACAEYIAPDEGDTGVLRKSLGLAGNTAFRLEEGADAGDGRLVAHAQGLVGDVASGSPHGGVFQIGARRWPVFGLDGPGDGEAIADPPGAPVVAFVGTLKPWHGVDVLLRARAQAHKDWKLRIIGDGPMRAELDDLARSLGIDVDFRGAVAPDAIPQHVAGTAIGVAPYPAMDTDSDQYFSPLKVYEYMAAGLPVVASRVGQLPEIMGESAYLVPPSDPEALAEALDALVANPVERARVGSDNRRQAEREHSWTGTVDHILAHAGVKEDVPHG